MVCLSADERCSAAILEHLQAADVGEKPPTGEADIPTSSEAGGSAWTGSRSHLSFVNRRPDPAPAKATKSTASRYYQLKIGHALIGQYLKRIGNREDDAYWWSHKPGVTHTWEHLFKVCTEWRKQMVLWKKVRSQTKRGRDRFRIADLFADGRCGETILEFLKTIDVGRKVREEEWEEGSDGFAEEEDEMVAEEEELAEMEVDGSGVL
jgi:hypothetical protein